MKNLLNKLLLTLELNNPFKSFPYILLICLPILIYLGERSFISYDEGYYALQGKWVLEYNNWLTPQWFDQIQFDRPPLLPVLIAISYKLFGVGHFSAHLPTLISSIVVLYFTCKVHELFLDKKFKWLSPLILITTYLWINYTHQATQDIILVSIEMFGIYFLIKSSNDSKNYEYILSTVWLGLCFFINTYMIAIPIIAISPYLFIYKKFLLKKNYFYVGILIGFIPFILWSIFCFNEYGFTFFEGINNKLISLSKNNTFSQPFYYYLWNFPISFLPWTPFCLYGIYAAAKKLSLKQNFIIVFYPLIIIFLLSLFETKIPYYSLQAFPLLSIATSYGLIQFCTDLSYKNIKTIRNTSLIIISALYITLIYILNNKGIFIFDNLKLLILLIGLSFLILPLFFLNVSSKKSFYTFTFLIGPYLAASLIVQSGLLSNRSPDIRIAVKNINNSILNNKFQTVVFTPSSMNGNELSELIKITLYTTEKIKRITDINKLQSEQNIWMKNTDINELKDFKVTYQDNRISNWVLVEKKLTSN